MLDPLGSTPQVPLEAAQCGYRVLSTCNNPILALMLQVLAEAPRRADFEAEISDLADSRRAGERFEVHLRRYIKPICPGCKRVIQADAYLWKKGETNPFARVVDCPNCHTAGEFPLENEDMAALQRPGSLALLRSRALERVGISRALEKTRCIAKCWNRYTERAFYTTLQPDQPNRSPAGRRTPNAPAAGIAAFRMRCRKFALDAPGQPAPVRG